MAEHRFGYVGLNTELGLTTNRTCRLRNVSPDRLAGLIEDNLAALREILKWNARHHIGIFRIGSGLIPFGSHHMNTLVWPMVFAEQLAAIGQWSQERGIRLTMHPGQYVTLNSPTSSVVQSAMDDLIYHATVLSSMGLGTASKMVIHTGGLYGDKEASISRFIHAWAMLPDAVKRRLVLENDDALFTVWDVLRIHDVTGIPIVFDVLHHEVNNTQRPEDRDLRGILEYCFRTWEPERDGPPKIHFATQDPEGCPGAHAPRIDVGAFLDLFYQTEDLDYDVVFECKDKEQSVLRVLEALGESRFVGLAYAV